MPSSDSLFTYTHKHGTEAQWNQVVNFIPYDREIIIYDKDATHDYDRLKVGDGIHLPKDLPFTGGESSSGSVVTVERLQHTLAFGSDQNYVFDGSADVVVPVYTGRYTSNHQDDGGDVGYQEDNFDDD